MEETFEYLDFLFSLSFVNAFFFLQPCIISIYTYLSFSSLGSNFGISTTEGWNRIGMVTGASGDLGTSEGGTWTLV